MSASTPQPAVHPYASIPLVLLTGVGRSGTTALRSAMAQHPDIDSTECENNVITDVIVAARRNCTVASRKHAMRVPQPRYDNLFRGLLLDLLWPSPKTGMNRPRAIAAFTSLPAAEADYLRQVFPGAKLLHLVRNGIEVVASRTKFDSFAKSPFESHCDVWSAGLGMIDWGHGRSGAGRTDYMLVRHEHLLCEEETPRVMSDIWRFVGLAPCAAAIEHLQQTVYHPTDPGAKGLIASGKKLAEVAADRKERWREWTLVQRQEFEKRCGEGMRRLGYEIPWLSSPVVVPKQQSGGKKSAA
jgi:hypothetical protein